MFKVLKRVMDILTVVNKLVKGYENSIQKLPQTEFTKRHMILILLCLLKRIFSNRTHKIYFPISWLWCGLEWIHTMNSLTNQSNCDNDNFRK